MEAKQVIASLDRPRFRQCIAKVIAELNADDCPFADQVDEEWAGVLLDAPDMVEELVLEAGDVHAEEIACVHFGATVVALALFDYFDAQALHEQFPDIGG